MRQRYIVLALILLITLALMLPSTAFSRDKDTSQPWDWKESGALGNGSAMSLAYDAGRDILYRGTHRGVYKYQGGTFTSLGGDIEPYNIVCLAYDSGRNVLYAGTSGILSNVPQGVWRCNNPDTSPSWTKIGPSEGDNYYGIFSLAYDSTNNVLYAGVADPGSDTGGVLRCDNPNTSPAWTDTEGALANYLVFSLAYDSTHNKLYAGTFYQGVWRCNSPNTSPVWVRISTSGNVGDFLIHGLAYDSTNNFLYAGTDSGVWRCDNPDAAYGWTMIGPTDDEAYSIHYLAYDSTRNLLYGTGGVGDVQGGFRCTNPDTAPNWIHMGGDLTHYTPYSLAYDSNNNALYYGTGNGLFRCASPNTSPAWTDTGSGVSDSIVDNLVYDQTRDIIYASIIEGGVWRCNNPEDESPSWTNIPGEGVRHRVGCLSYDQNHNVLYAGGTDDYDGRVFRCDNPDTSSNWTDIGGTLSKSHYDIDSLAYDSTRNILYLGSRGDGVWRCVSPDTSPSWTDTEGDVSNLAISCLAYDSNNNLLYAGAWYESVATQEGHGVWRCDNPDTNPEWTKISTSDNVGDTTVFSFAYDSTRNKLYAGCDLGVWRCDNPDTSHAWTDMEGDLPGGSIDCLAYDSADNVLYVGTCEGVFVYENPDNDPVLIDSGEDEMPYAITCMIVVPPEEEEEGTGGSGASSTIYAGTGGQGVWYADSQASSQKTWYLAEGSTGTNEQGTFETWVLVQNPGSETATVTLTYMTPSGEVTGPTQQIGAGSRTTFNVGDTPEVANEFNVSTKVTSDQPVIAERAMYWNAADGTYRRCAHDSIGVTGAATTWYLAEGSTGTNEQGTFETWVLVANPGEETATVTLTYMTPAGEIAGPTMEIAAGSRQSFNVADTPEVAGEFNVSTKVTSDKPVIAERAMYWNPASGTYRQAAHDSIGVTGTASTWYLAEGSTGTNEQGTFETWVLVANPGTDTATVSLTYMTPSGEVAGPSMEIAAGSRQSFNVADTPEVANEFSVSTRVTSDRPVIAERAMYWNPAGGPYRQAAHDSIGVTGAANTWDLAEGSTGTNEQGTFETWVLVQNPGDETATVSLTYMTPSGEVAGPSMEIAAGSRQSFNVADTPEVANVFSVSTRVTSDRPVIAERAMYWNPASGPYRQAAHDSIGVGI